MTRDKSFDAFERAKRVIPGGVNSTVRAFKGVGGTPVFVDRAHGCTLVDIDGNAYVDYVMSWGPLILGHAHPGVVAAVQDAAARGTSYGAPTQIESELAELVTAMVPSAEKVRFCSSGSEATTFALRLARGVTGRSAVLKFAGCYHGSVDAFLLSAGSSALTIGVPDSAGVTPGTIADTLVVPYNDLAAVQAAFAAHGPELAAVIVEPYVGNMGLVLPQPGFLAGLRAACDANGALLIFDEVMCGMGRTGTLFALEPDRVCPDIITVAKGLGAGYQPIGATLASERVVGAIAEGSGILANGHTYMSHAVACAASLAVLRTIEAEHLLQAVRRRGAELRAALDARFGQHPHVGDIRGAGLFQAVELVADRQTKAPFPRSARVAEAIKAAALEEGMICYPSAGAADGVSGDHVVLAPPYIVTADQVTEIVDRLDRAIARALPRAV